MSLTQARALELLTYYPETGQLFRKARIPGAAPSLITGTNSAGYVQLLVDGTHQYAHRVIWLMQTGAFPQGYIDHINGNRADNRWVNLRDVVQRINAQNLYRAHNDNKTGFMGVELHHSGQYAARIMAAGSRRWLGLFETPQEAHAAYLRAKRDLHPAAGINSMGDAA